MRQSLRAESPQIESPGEVSSEKPLHPVLSTALANLDIQLEDELAHYRRQRSGAGRTVRQGRTANKSLDLIAVSATGGRTRPLDDASRSNQPVNQSSRVGVGAEDLLKPTIDDSTIASATPELLPLAIAVRSEDSPLAPGGEQELATANQGQIVQPPNPDLDDYLESSEELLRSLAVEEAEIRSERGFMQSLLTPLGAGSMLLLLLSSAMFGYMVMNPFSLSRLTALGSSKTDPSVAATGAQTAPASALPQPNLAAQEFKDLNLNTLGTLKAGSGAVRSGAAASAIVSPTVAASAGSASTSGSIGTLSTRSGAANPSTASAQPSSKAASAASTQPRSAPVTETAPRRSSPVSSYTPPTRSYTPPTRAAYSRPALTRSAPAYIPPVAPAPVHSTTSQASPDSFPYKVVTPYDGDRALEQVRKVAPDGYVHNFPDGAKIQSGAYRNSTEAEARVQELRNQGISADVYKR